MSIKNTPIFHKLVDYIVVPGIVLLVVFYCVLIFLSRDMLGIPAMTFLLFLATLAMYLWTKPLWKASEKVEEELGSIPVWQRIFFGVLTIGASMGIFGQLQAGVTLEFTNAYLIFKLAFGLLAIPAFSYIALTGALPSWRSKQSGNDT
ncbi:MAG: hypothetical protein ACI80L_002872 [Pseudohongiellaceae bacterium]|jgi:hypothetical protein